MKIKVFALTLLVVMTIFFACDRDATKRKIKLSAEIMNTTSNHQLTTTIRLNERERRSIAVLFFKNLTGDDDLQWLQKGLTEMLIRSLSQSRYLSVLTTDRLFEILNQLGATEKLEDISIDMAALVAQEANIEAIITGHITKNGDNLKINVKLKEPHQGLILKEESVEGSGLENIFRMVDDLTQRIKDDLQLTFEKGETEKGIADITTNCLEAWKYYTSGLDLKNKLLISEAIPQFEKAIALDENFVAAYLNLCTVCLSRREHQKADQLFRKLMSLRDQATQQERYQIDLLAARFKNDAKMYVTTIQAWLQQNPDDIDANYMLADLYDGWNNPKQAIQYLQNVVKINNQYKLAYNKLGYQYAELGDFDKAIASLRKYQALAPDEPNPRDSMAEIYFLFGDYKNAEKHYKKALEINENFTPSLGNLGLLYLEKGEYKKALAIFKKYLEKVPDDNLKANAYSLLAYTYWRMGEYDRAIDYYQQSLKINAFNFVAIEFLYDIYREKNDSTKAHQVLQQIYSQIDEMRKADVLRFNSIYVQAWISFTWDINKEESIRILFDTISQSKASKTETIDELNLTNLKFFLTLLLFQTGREDEIDPLWEGKEVISSEIWQMFRAVQMHNYSDNWRAFGVLNQGFYKYINRGVEFYEPLIAHASEYEAKSMEMMFRLFLTDLYLRAQNLDLANQQLCLIGAPVEKVWQIIGPFDNNDGFRKIFPPEQKIELDETYHEDTGQISWQRAKDGTNDGFINLREMFERFNWSVAYGLIFIDSPDEKTVQFRFGTDDGSKLWLNGSEIWRLNQGGPAIFDDNKINVTLNKGINKVLIKVCNGPSDWGFFFRVTDHEGNGIPDIRFVSADEQT